MIAPPLTVTDSELDDIFSIFENVLEKIFKSN
jgi:4-aminobutyrate aminotransferase-like enzyme